MEFLASNPYALTLLIYSTVVLIISIYISLVLDDSVRWISFIMMSFSLWGFFYGIEITQSDIETILFLTRIQYLGIVAAPVTWVLFSLKYTGFQHETKRWMYPSLIGLAVVIYLVVVTDPIHHLQYKSTWLVKYGSFDLLGFERGPWYLVVVAYCYLFYFLGTFILLRRFRFANKHFKFQTRLLIVGGFFPLLINLTYQFSWFIPFGGIDATPFSFLFSYLFLGIAVLKFNLLKIKPFARNKILEAMSTGVLVFDHRNKLVDFNLSAKNFPLPQEKIRMGKSADQIFKDRPEILPLLNVTQPEILELRIAGPNGELVLKIKSIPILEGNPAISGVLLLVDDITEEIKTSERLQQQAFELQQLNTLKDKLFGIISHDLKGPVFGVKELIHLTQSGLVSKDEFMGMLPVVSKNLEQVAILLDNLLAWTSTQLRGEFLEYQQVNLENIISNQINLLERIAQEKSISIESEGLENLWVKADKNMMEMVFRNLISNAIKFSKPEQRIFISGERTGNYFKVCVRDSGLGISEENLKKLREGKSFTTRGSNNESGTGLGMILVKEFLLKNNGTLEIDSTLGKGSVFCIQLPALEVEPVD